MKSIFFMISLIFLLSCVSSKRYEIANSNYGKMAYNSDEYHKYLMWQLSYSQKYLEGEISREEFISLTQGITYHMSQLNNNDLK